MLIKQATNMSDMPDSNPPNDEGGEKKDIAHPTDTWKRDTGESDTPEALIAIGASAGGIEALESLIRQLHPDTRAAIIVVQHLSPSYPSKLGELIARYSPIEVITPKKTRVLKANTLYITPPNKDVEYRDGKIRLLKPDGSNPISPSVNRLFHSLARSMVHHPCHPKVTGIVLSGTGNDGASGLAEIETAGGQILIQAPETAKYDGMPKSSIAKVGLPMVLEPEKMAEVIESVSEKSDSSSHKGDNVVALGKKMKKLLDYISMESGINLKTFKQSTLERRTQRRMSLLRIKSIESYHKLLKENAREVRHFIESLSIPVTGFFRDPDVYEAMKPILHRGLVQAQKNNSPYRIWVAGCATGEEAYSLAMVMADISEKQHLTTNYQIFATDIAEDLVRAARHGYYNESSVKAVPTAFFDKHFEPRAGNFAIKPALREKVVFSTHNISTDPRFSRIDLISCRNVLIYFEEGAKDKVIRKFFSALNPDGLMLLGNGEILKTDQQLFSLADKRFRIYRKKETAQRRGSNEGFHLPQLKLNTQKSINPSQLSIEHQLSELVCSEILYPTLLIDNNDQITYTLGKSNDVIDINTGPFDRDIKNLLKDEYRQTTISLVEKLRTSKDPEQQKKQSFFSKEGSLEIIARQFDCSREGWVVIEFRPIKTEGVVTPQIEPGDEKILMIMQEELSYTKQNLQLSVQELKTSNEELITTNEELASTNEELDATNEELLTVNEELEIKSRQLYNTTNDLENLQKSSSLPILVIGRDLRIKIYTEPVMSLILNQSLQKADLFSAIDWLTPISGMREHIQSVLHTGKHFKNDIKLGDQYFQLHITPYTDENNNINGAMIFFTDITQLHLVQEDLHQEKHLAHITLETISDAVLRLNQDMSVEYMNPSAEVLCGCGKGDFAQKSILKILDFIDEQTRKPVINLLKHDNNDEKMAEAILINHNNYECTIEFSCTRLSDETNRLYGYLLVMRDISKRQAAMKKVLWQSTHDHLTGLVNRGEMEKRIQHSLNGSKDRGIECCFLFIDLDKFKIINDTCGHRAGDELLRRISQMIEAKLRSRDTLGRLGGDEFGILLENCNLDNAYKVALKIQKAISDYRFFWEKKLFKVGACMGIALINKHTSSVAQLLQDADTACYAAKNNGGNSIQIHSEDGIDINHQKEMMATVVDINSSLENHRFRLYYQPIFELKTKQICHWEVLARMINSKGELLLPYKFLPAAERFHYIKQIDLWVCKNALKSLNSLHEATEQRTKLALNLSASTLADSDCHKTLVNLLSEYKKLYGYISFEITETSALHNIDAVNNFIGKLRDFGCTLALDDFGTGVSTYSYLRKLDVDTIKIDGEFVKNICKDTVDQEIVNSIVRIAKLMNISTIAEWVSDSKVCNFVTDLGVDALQGFYIGRPIPAEEFRSIVVSNNFDTQFFKSQAE